MAEPGKTADAQKKKRRLSEAEELALDAQTERIAALGSQWSPTREALLEVILSVQDAATAEHRERQRVGIERARACGVVLGRPKKPLPANFDEVISQIERGRLSTVAAARACGVSRETLRTWRRRYGTQEKGDYEKGGHAQQQDQSV